MENQNPKENAKEEARERARRLLADAETQANQPPGPLPPDAPTYALRHPALDENGMPLPKRVEEIDMDATRVTPAAYQPPAAAAPPRRRGTGSTKRSRVRRRAPSGRAAWGCLLRGFITSLFVVVAVVILLLAFVLIQYYRIAATLPSVEDLRARASQFETTRILDRNGNLIYEINDPSAGRRTFVPLDEISPYMVAAIIATEDKGFYTHPGFDPSAILRAFWQNLTSDEIVSGASTITQQLARALLFTPEERTELSYWRKVREAILAAIRETASWGLTGIHDAGVPRSVIDIYEELAREGKFDLRNYVMIASDDSTLAHYLQRGPQNGLYDNRIWIRAIKISSDGALGSRGAALLEPYSDDPGNTGLLLVPPGRVQQVAVKALEKGFQVNVHAIGDRANRLVLDEFEKALAQVPVPDHRFRIEHAQVVHPDDIPRFARLGVIPSMQGSHQTSDMYWAVNRLGPTRVLGAYAWRSFLATGTVVPNGSDFPVEAVNPLVSFKAAISRQDARGWPAGGWYPEQRMTREEALKSITIWPAFAAFMEREVGSLEPGKLADFVVLDLDIMRIPADLILETKVLATYMGGKLVYERRDR